MFCKNCENLLSTDYTNEHYDLYCNLCNLKYKRSALNSKIYNDVKAIDNFNYDGSEIYHYKCNPKIRGKCPNEKCNYSIISWIKNINNEKIYGCRCGYSWVKN